MPLYDDIADAVDVVPDGTWQVNVMDLEDASLETNEEAWFGALADPGEGSVWLRIDLSSFADDVELKLWWAAKKTSGNYDPAVSRSTVFEVNIELVSYSPVDDVFDPNAPDWTVLSSEDFDGVFSFGRESAHAITDGYTLQGSRIYYMRFTPQGLGQTIPLFGTFEFGAAVDWDTTTSDVSVEFNSGAGVTESGGVLSTSAGINPDDFPGGYPSPIDGPWTFRVSGSELPPAGQYRVELEMRCTTTPQSELMFMVARRNGLTVGIGMLGGFTGDTSLTGSFVWRELTDYVAFGGYSPDMFGPSALPVLPGDTYEFAIFNWYEDPGAETYEIRGLRWRPYIVGGSAGPPINLLDIPDIPAGATDFTDIPDLSALIGEGSYDPWIFDMAVDDSGNVYVSFTVTSATSAPKSVLGVLKWNGSSWSLLTKDPFNLGGDASFHVADNVSGGIIMWSMDCDGTDLYFAFGITYGTALPGDGLFESEIRVTKVTAGGSVSNVGSPLQPLPSSTYTTTPGQYDQGIPLVKCSPQGVPWLAFATNDPTTSIGFSWANVGFVYRWDGAAWVDTNFWASAAFVNPHSSPTPESGDLNAVDPYPKTSIELAFRQNASDDAAEYPIAIYNVWYDASPFDLDKPVGENYVSGYNPDDTWQTPTIFRFVDFFPPGDEFAQSGSQQWGEISVQAMRLVASPTRFYVAAALWSGLVGTEGVMALEIVPEEGGFSFAPITETVFEGRRISPRRPVDGQLLWVDPTAIELGVTWEDDSDSVWFGYDSNQLDWHPVIGQIAEVGNGDGFAWASKNNMPFAGNADGTSRLIAKDGVVYWFGGLYIDTPSVSRFEPMLWVMPVDDTYVPWRPGPGVAFRPHIYRRILG